MKALVIFTHPNRNSLNGAFLNEAMEGLNANPAIQDIRVTDLYKEQFDPILRFDGDKRRRDMHTNPAFAVHRENLAWADLVVFVYPVWWGRPPAMLMGYFDQVLSKNFAYRYRQISALPEGLLKGKKAICLYTMKGPNFYSRWVLKNSHEINLKRAVLSFVGFSKVKFLSFGGMEKKDGSQKRRLAQVREFMSRVAA